MQNKRLLICILALGLVTVSACATVQHGSHTAFVVKTDPAGATVTTDEETPASKRKRARTGAGPETAEYYGCAPTPCSFNLPRRSDFNVLVSKEGYRPFTWAVSKDRNSIVAKKATEQGTVVAAVAGAGYAAYVLSGAGDVAASSNYLVWSSSSINTMNAFAGLYYGTVALGASSLVDNMSGSLVELYPNPLLIQMATEQSPEDSQKLIVAFNRSREAHTAEKE